MSFFEFPHTRTYDSDLGWIIKQVKTNEEAIAALEAWKEETQPTIDDLKKLYDDICRGNLPEGMKEGIKKWLERNALDLLGDLVKMVIFNITDDGYFVAYVPESWNEIIFNTTGYDINIPIQPDYGHLVLSYAADVNAF